MSDKSKPDFHQRAERLGESPRPRGTAKAGPPPNPPPRATNPPPNAQKRPQPTTITLIGPSQSGKTHMMSTIVHSPQTALRDLKEGPNALADAAIFSPGAFESEKVEEDWNVLSRHYDMLLHGRDVDNSGSDLQRDYRFSILQTKRAGDRFGRGGWPLSWFRKRPGNANGQLDLRLIDDRGGALARPREHARGDTVNQKRIEAYRTAVAGSSGLIVCLPFGDRDYNDRAASALKLEIDLALSKTKTPIRHVAICLTKFESLFTTFGADAASKAKSLDLLRQHLSRFGYMELVKTIFAYTEASFWLKKLTARVFPVSTYGFVRGTGAANFYPWKLRPGLMTRSVEEEDYEDFDVWLRRERKQAENEEMPFSYEGCSHLRDHYPVEIPEGHAKSLWHPFNIAPPLLFAATGRETGPMCLTKADLEI